MIPKYLFRTLLLLLPLLLCGISLHAQDRMRFTRVVASLPTLDSLSAEQLDELSFQVFRAVVELRDALRERSKSQDAEFQNLESGLVAAKADSTASVETLKSLEAEVKATRNWSKSAQALVRQAEKITSFSARTVDADSAQQRKDLPRVFGQYKQMLDTHFPFPRIKLDVGEVLVAPPLVADSSAVQKEKPKTKKSAAEARPVYARYEPSRDPELNPPPAGCTLLLNTRDEFSGQVRQETDKIILLRHTPAPLRPLYEGRQQVLLEAAATRLGEQINLNLQFSIQDANARRSFGTLARGSQIILRFIDGYTITLSNSRQDEGANDAEGNAIIYRGQYALDKFQLKKVQGTALDKIRVNWSAGYEDYEVQRVDALQAIMRCMQ